jgi:hypothetical protein
MQEARSLQIGELHLRDEVIKHASNAVRDVRRPVELRLASPVRKGQPSPGRASTSKGSAALTTLVKVGAWRNLVQRLLDQTNYRKSVDQVLALLQVLNCDVDLVVRTKTA